VCFLKKIVLKSTNKPKFHFLGGHCTFCTCCNDATALGKRLYCPPNFQNAYNYLTTPLSTIYNPHDCYFTLYTTSGTVPNTNNWRTIFIYNYCVNLHSGSSLLRIGNALYTYDQSKANFMIDTPRYFIAWLDTQSLNTSSPDSKYYYSDGYPVPGPFNF